MSRRTFALFILLSLVLHLLGAGLLVLTPRGQPRPDEPIEVTILAEPPAPKSAAQDEQLKQIVDSPEQAINDELDKNAKLLSRHNQRVERETRAERSGQFRNSDNGAQTPEPSQRHSQLPSQAASEASSEEPAKSERGPGKKLKMADLVKPLNWSRETFAAKQGEGPSQTDDHLKDVAAGAQTLLNTKEYVYFTYYARIKDKLRQYWEPKIKDKVQRLLAQGRTIASSEDRITKMIITLDKRGVLVKVQVIGESGIRDLDDAAVEAFRSAAPFPNPPIGIVDSDGTIKIRWDFVLEARNINIWSDRPFFAAAETKWV